MGTGRYGLAGTGTQTAALAAGGYGTGIVALVEEYNGAAWSEVTNLPANTKGATAVGPQTAALLAGGGPPAGNESFDYDGSSWTATPDLNTARFGMGGNGIATAALFASGSAVTSEGNLAATEEYDGSSWTNGGNVNTAR